MALTLPHDNELILEYPYQEDLTFKTVISQAENGVEQRQQRWSQGKRTFSLKYMNYRKHLNRLYNFYTLCAGSAKSFNFQPVIDPLLPYDQTTIWLPLHEGGGAKVDDWNGYIFPALTCRFMDDNLSLEEFSVRLQRIGIKIYQFEPIVFTNNYGILTGGAWNLCPDYSSCISFNGSSDYLSLGDAADADVGTGNFSFAFCIYANSLSAILYVMSKYTNIGGAAGYELYITTNGVIICVVTDGTHTNSIGSATSAIPNQSWKIVAVTVNRSGNGQIYVNGVASGSPTAITATSTMSNATSLYLGRIEGIGYANCKLRNFLFAKKVWTQTELDLIFDTWRPIFGI